MWVREEKHGDLRNQSNASPPSSLLPALPGVKTDRRSRVTEATLGHHLMPHYEGA